MVDTKGKWRHRTVCQRKSEKGGVIATRVNEFIFRVLKARKIKAWVKLWEQSRSQ